MKILFVTEEGESPGAIYRSFLPAKYLRTLGYEVRVCHHITSNGKILGVDERGLFTPDIIVTRKIADPKRKYCANFSGWINEGRSNGQRIYYEVDDSPWMMPSWATDKEAEDAPTVEANMLACDGVIVSTPFLAHLIKQRLNINAHICPSGVDTKIFNQHKDHEPIRVGWIGDTKFRGPCLERHANLIFGAMAQAHTPYQFWHLGYRSDRKPVQAYMNGWDEAIDVVERPWVVYSKLPTMLTQIDMAIIPDEDDEFNRCRSATTGLAMAAAGLPFIAAHQVEYDRLVNEHSIGVTTDSWQEIPLMIDEIKYRRILGSFNQLQTRRHFDYTVTGQTWEKVVNGVPAI